MCTVDDAKKIATAVQCGTTAVIERAAHLLPLEHPKQLAELLDHNLT